MKVHHLSNKVSYLMMVLTAYIFLSILSLFPARAMEPPRPGEIEKLKAEGKFESRQEMAKKIGNHKVDPYLLERAVIKLKRKILKSQGMTESEIDAILPAVPPPAWQGMPSTGNVKTFALLIEFQDHTHTVSETDINDMLYGNGNPANFPRESLTNYYDRASYGLIDLGNGTTLGWYQTAYNRSAVTTDTTGRENLIKEALNYYDTAGHDFSQYDNDGDGDIDYFIVMWTGPDTGWGSFWWGYRHSWIDGGYNLDGKTLYWYSWQWESNNPTVVIHETGHGLGLPDLYDYDDTVGPDGGVGGFDMMDGNTGDHNCFSKWMLDWLTPIVVAGTRQDITLDDTATSKDCVLIWPGVSLGDIFSEFFIVQNRQDIENDSSVWFTLDGLSIWHIDATLNGAGTSFAYDNQYTDHKFVRLMEADGLEEIEAEPSGDLADSGDIYTAGDVIGTNTAPSSDKYDGTDSCVTVWDITDLSTVPGAEITASFSTICGEADLDITKTDDVDPVVAGNDLVYTLTVYNAGPDIAQHVMITDTLPSGEQYVSASGTNWSCNHSNGIISCDWQGGTPVGSLSAGLTTDPITITVKVLSETSGQLINNANVTSSTPDPAMSNNFTEEDTLVIGEADLQFLSKTDTPDPVVAGTNLTYTLSVVNNGPSSAENVKIVDPLPANTVFVSATPSAGGSCVTPSPGFTGTVTCTWGGLTPPTPDPASVRTVTIVVQVLPSTPNGTIITNTATTTSDTTDPLSTNNSRTATTTVNTQADLSIEKDDFPFDPVVAGQDTITYKVTVTNGGPSDAQNVLVVDTLPAGVTFMSTVGCAEDPNAAVAGIVTCTLGTMPAGSSKQFTVKVSVDASTVGIITDTVTVSSTTNDINLANNTATEDTLVLSIADVSVTKDDDPDPVLPNNPLTYTITVYNAGPSDAQLVDVNDTLPPQVTFVSTNGCLNDPNGVPVCNLGTVPAGTSVQYTINVHVPLGSGGQIIQNTAQAVVGGGSTDPDLSNNTDTEDTAILAPIVLNEPGSLLVYPLIDNINYNTIINIANMSSQDVVLECYMVTHGVGTPIDEKKDFIIKMSQKEKFWWNTAFPYDRTNANGDRVMIGDFDDRKGYMFCWAIDDDINQREIMFNNLKGDATVLDIQKALNYNAIAMQAFPGLVSDRRLLLDGIEYAAGTGTIFFEGFSGNAFGIVQGTLAVADIDIDLVLSRQPEFDINVVCWNEDEVKFSRHLHYKDFEQYDLIEDLRLDTRSIFTEGFQCEATAGPWINPFDGTVIAPGALWAVFMQRANNIMTGGNVWQPGQGTAPVARSCIRLPGGPACPNY